jgi:putative tricarboxylic transport membrane protein
MLETIGHLMGGFSSAVQPYSLLFCFIGVFLGLIVGVLPGLGPSAGTALLLPFVFGMNPSYALIMLAGIYYGAQYGGAITAILLNIPGEASAVLTAVEGYPLYTQGKGAQALRVSFSASFIGGTLSVILLTFFAPVLAMWCLKFGSAERFALMLFAFVFVACLSRKNVAKSFIALAVGLALGTVGMHPMTGFPRFTFEKLWLLDGFDFTIAVLGFFAVCEIMKQVEGGYDEGYNAQVRKISIKDILPRFKEMWALRMSVARGWMIGFITGVLPGAGATIATFISYNTEKKVSKHPEKFGTGAIEGIAAAEAANNSASTGAMVPLMGMGIPGSGTAAVLLSGFIMVGLQPGPTLFVDRPDVAWSLIASMYVGNVMLILMCLFGLSAFVWLVKKSFSFIIPLIIVVCIAGAYSANSWIRDLWVLLGFGIFAYIFSLMEFPIINMILGLILGKDMEINFLRSLILSDGDVTVFIRRPISGTMIAVSVLLIIWPLLKKVFYKLLHLKGAAHE